MRTGELYAEGRERIVGMVTGLVTRAGRRDGADVPRVVGRRRPRAT